MSSVSISTYSEVARIKASLNMFIRQANITKVAMNKNFVPSPMMRAGIGGKINTLA